MCLYSADHSVVCNLCVYKFKSDGDLKLDSFFQCHHHNEIIGRLDSLSTAVREINNSVLSCLSRLADIEVVVSAGVPCDWSLPSDLPTAFSTQPLHPSIQQQSQTLSTHTPNFTDQPSLSIHSSTPSSSQQPLPTSNQGRVPYTPRSANTLHHSSSILSPIPSGPQPQQPVPHTPRSAHHHHQPSPSVLSPIPSAGETTTPTKDSTELLTLDQVMRIKNMSSSRMNFAANLNRRLFTEEERAASNVRGKANKQMLDVKTVDYIKKVTFRLYPLESSEKEKTAWNACVIAVDEANRRLNKKKSA